MIQTRANLKLARCAIVTRLAAALAYGAVAPPHVAAFRRPVGFLVAPRLVKPSEAFRTSGHVAVAKPPKCRKSTLAKVAAETNKKNIQR